MPGAEPEEIHDNPTGWVNKHIREYVTSDGRRGHRWRGLPTLLLTTRGRRSGKLRRTALIYGRDGDRYLVVPSSGGGPDHPQWFRNLLADPQVGVQVGAELFVARARRATAAEQPALWAVMAAIFPTYDSYQTRAAKYGRDIPVVVLERA